MKILILLFIMLSLIGRRNATGQLIIGQVRNDLGQELYNVSIEIKNSKESTLTDCQGIFQINANLGDTIIVSRENYNAEVGVLKTYFKNFIVLRFDYAKFRKEVESDPRLNSLCNEGNGQPLLILDGKHAKSAYYISNINALTEDDILPLIVLKGKKATDRFGHCARNGAIWITTNCQK